MEQVNTEQVNTEQVKQPKKIGVSVKGLIKHISYDTSEEGVVGISWDYKNGKLDKFMDKEYRPNYGDNNNMMWVQKIKELSGWVQGESLYCVMKCNCDGWFNVWYSKVKEHNCYDLIVEPTGFVSRRYYNHYTMKENEADEIRYSTMIRPSSVYNDWWCKELEKDPVLKKTFWKR